MLLVAYDTHLINCKGKIAVSTDCHVPLQYDLGETSTFPGPCTFALGFCPNICEILEIVCVVQIKCYLTSKCFISMETLALCICLSIKSLPK